MRDESDFNSKQRLEIFQWCAAMLEQLQDTLDTIRLARELLYGVEHRQSVMPGKYSPGCHDLARVLWRWGGEGHQDGQHCVRCPWI